MSLFTPVTGLLGGSMIGASAATLLLFNGDIMGLSGIFSTTCLHPIKTYKEQPWKLVFLASFMTAAAVYVTYIDPSCIQQDPSIPIPSSVAYLLGGWLVGFGTKLGNGCTSGHGICGLARFSKRSFVAVSTFMGTGILTTLLIANDSNAFRTTETSLELKSLYGVAVAAISTLAALPSLSQPKSLGALLSGGLCAVGLAISGMILPSKIQNFLNLSLLSSGGGYDPTLMTVMGGGVVTSWLGYQLLSSYSMILPQDKCMEKPLREQEFHVPTSKIVDRKLVGGAAIFGVGWGLACFCPGPAFVHVAAGASSALQLWFPTFLVGSYCAEKVIQFTKKKNI